MNHRISQAIPRQTCASVTAEPAGPCWGSPDSLRQVGVFHGHTVCLPHLLHVAQHVLPAVEDALPLLRVQVEDEVSGVVLIALLVPAGDGRLSQRWPLPPPAFAKL